MIHPRSLLLTFVVAVALAGLPAVGHTSGDIRVNGDLPGTVQNEIRITRNATDLLNLALVYNDGIGLPASPLGVSFTLDGGATWSDRQLSVPRHPIMGTPDDNLALTAIFDPYIDSDPSGNLYAGYIANAGYSTPNGIFIERSIDKGNSWSGPTTIAFNLRAAGPADPNYRYNDRPDMMADASGNVLVVWIKDVGMTTPASDIYFARSGPPSATSISNPTGLDFTAASAGSVAPKTVNDHPNGTDWANVPDVVVASDGTIYVSWINVDVTNPLVKPGMLMLDQSRDGGVTFGADRQVQAITALPKWLHTSLGATDAWAGSYPVIGVSPANPAEVYMAYAAVGAGGDEGDIFFVRSSDRGVTWSAPMRVNADVTAYDQFHPVMTVAPNGRIDLAWYDKRNSSSDDRWDVYLASSWNGGRSFGPNVRISDQTFATPTDAWGQPWMGEYFALEADAATAFLAFTSSISDARGDIYYDTLALPSATCGGRRATIVGTAGADRLNGTSGADVISGLGGGDVISGLGGNDLVCGGAGRDRITGGAGNDRLRGGLEGDTLHGSAGNDRLAGGPGVDLADGGTGTDSCRAESKTACE